MIDVIRGYIVTFIAAAGGIASMIGVSYHSFSTTSAETVAAVLVLSGFAMFFFIDSIQMRARWKRRIRYADVFENLNRGFKEIHNLSRKEGVTPDVVKQSFRDLCDEVASAFQHVTGKKCCVCIKVPVESQSKESGSKESVFRTLCRSKNSVEERFVGDSNTAVRHTMNGNTAFQIAHMALKTSEKGFFSNRLPWLDGYENSSFKLYQKQRHEGLNPVMRWYKWPLPYCSAIVVPIFPLHTECNDGVLLGFLCLDSPRFWAFNYSYDVDILRGIADGVYNTLKRFQESV